MEGSLAGKLLVAMPGIGDPRFDQAVILMCLHTSETAMGLIVNKPRAELTLGDVLGHLGIEAEPTLAARSVLAGGPVKQDRGYVLHSQDFSAEDATQAVAPGVNLTATRDVLARNAGHPGHVFNLGHGVMPETDPAVLERIVELVHAEGRCDGTIGGREARSA